MDWSIILCFAFANIIPIQSSILGDVLRGHFLLRSSSDLRAIIAKRRYSARDLANRNKDYIIISAPKDLSREGSLPEYAVIRPGKKLKYHNKIPFGMKKRPDYTKNYLLRLLQYLADQRRSTPMSSHSQVDEDRVLPPSEPSRPGHSLIQPTKTMLKSSAKYPRSDGQSLVYGSLDNLGIVHGKTPYRVTYSDFRKANLFELLAKLMQSNSSSIGSLRRSRPVRLKGKTTKLKGKKTKKPLKQEQKKKRKFKKLDSRAKHEDSEASSEIQSEEQYVERKKRKSRHFKQRSVKDSDESKDAGTRAFGKFKKKTKLQFQPKKKKKTSITDIKVNKYNKIVDKLKDKLEEKLKSSKLKKKVPLSTYKSKKYTPKNKPRLIRQKNRDKSSLTDSNSREESLKYRSSREYKSRNYKSYNKPKYYRNKSKKKQIFRQNDNDEDAEDDSNKGYKSDKKPKGNNKKKKPEDDDKENKARLVYGSPDNYGIVWGKKPYRTLYSDFRRTRNLLSKILEAYHSYKREKNLKKALVAIRVWPLDKTKVNRGNLDTVKNQLLLNDGNEILDDTSIEISNVEAEFRKQRKPKVKSAFRNRDDNYDKGNKSKDCDGSDEKSESNESDYEKNPGNPYTLFKNKYRQNWPWHFELGDHINLNPFGPQFNNQGPSGADFFFNRKWWYFNQDDYIPFR